MNSKGVSPVIATVLLILVAVSVTAVIAYWTIQMVTSTTGDAESFVEAITEATESPAEFKGNWLQGAQGGTPRFGHSSVLFNGKIYSWGGMAGVGPEAEALNSLDVYE